MKNLKIIIPAVVMTVIVQFFLVRGFVGQSNEELSRVVGDIDTGLPHPSSEYDAKQVVQVLLYALRHQDVPYPEAGLKAFWQFCTPRLKGLWRDKAMLRAQLGEDIWLALRDFDEYQLEHAVISESDASFEVILRSQKRLERKFIVSLKLISQAWLIDMVAKKS